MSAPIYALLKRPDELFVVEHAHLQPRFVEDTVRVMIGRVLERYGSELGDGDFVHARQVNFETIHNHEVLAERSGAVGELRDEPRAASSRVATASSETGCSTAPEGPREREARAPLLAPQQPAQVAAVEDDDRAPGPDREAEHRPRRAEEERRIAAASSRRDRRDRRIAGQEEDGDPDRRAHRLTSGATASATPPVVPTTLPPLAKPRKSGRQCPTSAALPASDADQLVADEPPEQAGRKTLADVEERDGDAEARAADPPDVRRADVSGADRADIDVLAADEAASSPRAGFREGSLPR